jgi:hypothetical protein
MVGASALWGAKPISEHRSKAMNESPASRCRRFTAVIATIALGAVAGCGNAHVFSVDPGHIDPDVLATAAAGLDGADVQLRRYSTGCDANTPEPLTAKVGDGMEFTADQMKALPSPCPASPNPGVEVQVERRSLIFDFSNVERVGVFPEFEFEGYLLDISREDGPQLVLAVVDRQLTNVDVENEDLAYDHDHLEVNFAGATFDSDGFVKIDLFFAHVAPRTGDAE